MSREMRHPELRPQSYPFAGIATFLRSEAVRDLAGISADIAFLGVPTDEGSPFMPGSRFAPRAIREQSLRFGQQGYYDHRDGSLHLVHELTNRRIVDYGDSDILPTNIEDSFANITRDVSQILVNGLLPVVVGGDHAISFPVVRAFAEPIHVVHFDAHVDYAPFRHGYEFTNAHAFRHIHHMDHVQSLTQVGVRSLRDPEEWVMDSVRDGNHVVSIYDFWKGRERAVIDHLPPGAKCYVSIDIDVLDMSLVPGCVSGEPNGMTYGELRDVLTALASHTEIVGFDVVEVNPLLDVGTSPTSYLAAHLILEFLGQITAQQSWRRNHDSDPRVGPVAG